MRASWPMTAAEGVYVGRLARGEAVPHFPGACAREDCAHLTLWHGEHGKFKGRPCRRCACPGYVEQPATPPEPPDWLADCAAGVL